MWILLYPLALRGPHAPTEDKALDLFSMFSKLILLLNICHLGGCSFAGYTFLFSLELLLYTSPQFPTNIIVVVVLFILN